MFLCQALHTKKYVGTWLDSMGIYLFEGTAGDDGRTITMERHDDNPMAGPMKLRAVTKIIDPNTEIFEMHGTDKSGQEMKMMEICYSRKGWRCSRAVCLQRCGLLLIGDCSDILS